MDAEDNKERTKLRRKVEAYNMILNLLWSFLCLTPIVYFCYITLEPNWLYLFIGISFVTFLLPNSFFSAIKLGKKETIYKKIGIRTVKKYTQNGDLINKIIRRKFPAYRNVNNSMLIKGHIKKASFNEKFHFGMFLFFLLTSIYALANGYIGWTVVITLANLIYNIYPILLIQYNRLRFHQLSRRIR